MLNQFTIRHLDAFELLLSPLPQPLVPLKAVGMPNLNSIPICLPDLTRGSRLLVETEGDVMLAASFAVTGHIELFRGQCCEQVKIYPDVDDGVVADLPLDQSLS